MTFLKGEIEVPGSKHTFFNSSAVSILSLLASPRVEVLGSVTDLAVETKSFEKEADVTSCAITLALAPSPLHPIPTPFKLTKKNKLPLNISLNPLPLSCSHLTQNMITYLHIHTQ